LKFLSNVDLAYHWRWFDREIFLVLWIMITGCFACSCWQADHPRAQVICRDHHRRFLPVPGSRLWGAPLKIGCCLPSAADYAGFRLYTKAPEQKREVKYSSLFKAPLGLPAYFDYQEARAYARSVHKPLLIDFTGHACVNCRKMESAIWPDANVFPLIRDQYILVQLYVDDKTRIGQSPLVSKTVMLQAKNSTVTASLFMCWPILKAEKPLTASQGAIYDAGAYAAYLKMGLKGFALKK